MKKVKLYAMAFAAMFFAASCQDDAIDPGQGQGNGGDGTPAYLTLSFTANGGSSTRSTADDANNQGDEDGNAEDSGHHNSGTANEQKVDKALVVITSVGGGNVNYARLYSTKTDATANQDGTFDVTNAVGEIEYVNNAPIPLTVGTYNVLVVANPDEALYSGMTGGDINSGILNTNSVEDLYAKITNNEYAPTEEDYASIAAGTLDYNADDQNSDDDNGFRIMMANKAECQVTLGEENTVDNPKVASIDVERAYSKITFRETNNNIYQVDVNLSQVQAVIVKGAINTAEEGETENWTIVDLNKAWDANETANEIYVWWEAAADGNSNATLKGVYRKTDDTHTEDSTPYPVFVKLTPVKADSFTNEETQYVVAWEGNVSDEASVHPTDGINYVGESQGNIDHWYVKLEGYALVNLSKSLYYVRHITDNMGAGAAFGTLNGQNYLFTPNWTAKNDDNNIVTNEQTGEVSFKNNVDETWFYNTLAQVSEESKGMTIDNSGDFKVGAENAEYYKKITTLGAQDSGTMSGEDHYEGETTLPNVGKFMSYCFENSTDIDHQLHGISTGISFVARIYSDESCNTAVEKFYRYNNHLFESLADIQEAYGVNTMSTKFNELVEKENGESDDNTITKEDLEELAAFTPENNNTGQGDTKKQGEKIDLYEGGICYYYTTEIKHFDNGDNASLGNMEFAIMRNNIYSLAVTDINEIGDPFVDPTPDKPNENPEVKTALNVEVKILPWIVRYNDIEF